MKAFEVYYGDGSVHRGRTLADWAKIPRENVQVILYRHDDGYANTIVCEFDYYYVDDNGSVTGCDGERPNRYHLDGKLMDKEAYRALKRNTRPSSILWNDHNLKDF